MYQRLYQNYKPGKWYWVVVVILRKFFIAVTGLMFRKTPGF